MSDYLELQPGSSHWDIVVVVGDLWPCINKVLRSDDTVTHLPYRPLQMESIEPFVVDHLQLQLTGGAEGYRVHLKHVEIFGASNFTVQNMRLAEDDKPFELAVYIPKLTIKAKYSSSGVLIIIPASGGGDFAAIFGEFLWVQIILLF